MFIVGPTQSKVPLGFLGVNATASVIGFSNSYFRSACDSLLGRERTVSPEALIGSVRGEHLRVESGADPPARIFKLYVRRVGQDFE
jgi:hypothetical protein